MATTTNYGWTTPDDTDLVKDGAAAIRTLGSSVDTTTKALNPSTTLGDIEYRSSTANTNTRLAIGSTGNVLTVAGGVPTWAVPASGGMTLLSTTTLSGATTTISSIDGSYKDLQIIISGITINAGAAVVTVRPNAANIASYGLQANATNSDGTNEIILSANKTIPSTGGENAWAMTIFNYASSSYYKTFTWAGRTFDSVTWGITGGGGLTTTSPITSYEIACGGGRTFSGGQVLIYGVK